ncbi:FAD-dependent oxidoreductase [Candidatus Binatus sp.]|uniref:FAD-dependent oxidoreductase n=1 Tax=Candidatus Binatus sp. TaxID=2811406 RepID=UPI003BAFD362
MNRQFTTDVLIAGAGAAGLTLAIDLARRNVAFRLIDKLPSPFAGSRGKGIQPRSQEIFEDLGVIDRLVAVGGTYPPQREYREDGTYEDSPRMEEHEATPDEPYLIPLMVPQFLTEAVLRERLAEFGHRPNFGCELTAFEQDAEGVTAHVKSADGEETLRVGYLVGMDGGKSYVRHALNIEFPGKTLRVRAMVADVRLEGLGTDAWHRFNEGSMEKQTSFCPLRGTDMFQVQAPIPMKGDINLSAEGLTAWAAARTGREDIVIREVLWASAFNMNARMADKYRVGRVFIGGDAAHIHPPTGGQGLNTSVQDAYNLGWKLAAVINGAPEKLLATYEEERRPIAAEMLGLSTKLLRAAKERGGMRRGRETHQLDLGYPESSLSLNKPARSPELVIAGDRAPDAPIRGAAGQSTRLFKLFQGPHWTLLGYEVDRAAVAPRRDLHIHTVGARGDIIDEGGLVRDGYGLSAGDWVLVRPDGYVGAIVSSSEIAALRRYLDDVGIAPID